MKDSIAILGNRDENKSSIFFQNEDTINISKINFLQSSESLSETSTLDFNNFSNNEFRARLTFHRWKTRRVNAFLQGSFFQSENRCSPLGPDESKWLLSPHGCPRDFNVRFRVMEFSVFFRVHVYSRPRY